ncbi:hypothetical protein Tco_0389963 [Tanacetum coccineum]
MSNLLKIKRRLVFDSPPKVENEVDELENGTCAQTSALRIRRGSASVRGNTLRKTSGSEYNVMGLPAPAWPIGITPEDCRIHAERPEPVVLPEELVLQEHYQMRMFRQRIIKEQELNNNSLN